VQIYLLNLNYLPIFMIPSHGFQQFFPKQKKDPKEGGTMH